MLFLGSDAAECAIRSEVSVTKKMNPRRASDRNKPEASMPATIWQIHERLSMVPPLAFEVRQRPGRKEARYSGPRTRANRGIK
jgi:hypothetical protein